MSIETAPQFGDEQTGPMHIVQTVPDDLKREAQARITLHDVESTFSQMESRAAVYDKFQIFSCDAGNGFVVAGPHSDKLHIEMIYSRLPGLLDRQIDYWLNIAWDCSFSGLQAKPGSHGMERLMRQIGMQKNESGHFIYGLKPQSKLEIN